MISNEKGTDECNKQAGDRRHTGILREDSDKVRNKCKGGLPQGIYRKDSVFSSAMNNPTRLLTSLSALERFTNDALRLKHDPGYLNGFHFNRELLKAAVANTYIETVGTRSDSMHLAIEHYPVTDTVKGIRDSLFSRISTLSRRPISENTDPIMIAFDYTHEDFYGDRDTL